MDRFTVTRRQAIHAAAIGLGAATIRPSLAAEEAAIEVNEGDLILFQGDSITDARRDRKREGNANDAAALGNGYPALLAASLRRDHPAKNLRVLNRGISGNKVPDLDNRWQKDCLDLKPSLLSILIGVNDMWRTKDRGYEGTPESYGRELTALLDRTRQALPDTTLVIIEPFVTRTGAVRDDWFPAMDERRAAAKATADEAGAVWIPMQSIFDNATTDAAGPAYWCHDGVHPTLAGHALIAKAWRAATGL